MIRILSLSVLVFACGKAPATKQAQPPSHNEYAVSTAADLPACDDAHADWLYFVQADKSFHVCQAGAWSVIDLKGKDGANGAAGAAGAAGAPGKDATASSLVGSSIYCTGVLPTTALQFEYQAVLMKSGDVFAKAGVYGNGAEFGGSNFFSKAQVGALTAAVVFTYDYDSTANYGFWTLSLDRTSLVTTILYKDIDASGGQTTWTMTPDKCVANTY